MVRFIVFISTILIIGISITISMLNTGVIEIDLYFKKYTEPVTIFLFISFLVGCFLTLMFFLSAYIKHKHENINLKKSMKIKEDEIDSLRKSPIREDH
ncbi:MAG: LapA family protein [Pseudomonadota bacterium]|nr:LapA family protein [Pseudomonadota bacterium]